jgi:hypothetical protein
MASTFPAPICATHDTRCIAYMQICAEFLPNRTIIVDNSERRWYTLCPWVQLWLSPNGFRCDISCVGRSGSVKYRRYCLARPEALCGSSDVELPKTLCRIAPKSLVYVGSTYRRRYAKCVAWLSLSLFGNLCNTEFYENPSHNRWYYVTDRRTDGRGLHVTLLLFRK